MTSCFVSLESERWVYKNALRKRWNRSSATPSTRKSASLPRRKVRISGSRRGRRCSTSAPTTISASPTIPRSSPPRTRRLTITASAWRRCVSSAAPRICTRNWSATIAHFLGTDDAILYSSCFDANGGLFETLLGEEDAVISDELNHASIIDGIRLCKAQRLRYKHADMADLEAQLVAAKGARHAADRHRRRLQHGRRHRAASRGCRSRDEA